MSGLGQFFLVYGQAAQGLRVGVPGSEISLPVLDPQVPAGRDGRRGIAMGLPEEWKGLGPGPPGGGAVPVGFVFDPGDKGAAELADVAEEGALGEAGVEEEGVDPREGPGEPDHDPLCSSDFRLPMADQFDA